MEGGYSNAFELICPACGDDPGLDFACRSLPGCSGFAGRARCRWPSRRTRNTSGCVPGQMRSALVAQVLELRRLV